MTEKDSFAKYRIVLPFWVTDRVQAIEDLIGDLRLSQTALYNQHTDDAKRVWRDTIHLLNYWIEYIDDPNVQQHDNWSKKYWMTP